MDVVQCTCLGSMGRFGKCLWQHSVSSKYAMLTGSLFESHRWVGHDLFDIPYHPPSRTLVRTELDSLDWETSNIDLLGYFQFQDAVDRLRRSELKEMFRFKSEFRDRFPKREHYIAAHLRTGDYFSMSDVFCNITEQSYFIACRKFGLDVSKMVFVREDQPQSAPDLEVRGLGFIPDFFTLMNADVILRANSTFSWWAATLSLARVFAPVVEDRVGPNDVEFVEGNWPRCVDASRCGGRVTDLHLPE